MSIRDVDESLVSFRGEEHGRISSDYEKKRDVTLPLFVQKHRGLAAEYGCESQVVASRARCHRCWAPEGPPLGVRFHLLSARYRSSTQETYANHLVATGGRLRHHAARETFQELRLGSRATNVVEAAHRPRDESTAETRGAGS